MASSYPSGLDALTNPLPGDSTVTVSHAAQHGNANDAIEAIEATLGVNPQGGSASVKARLDAADTATAARAVGAASSTDNTLPRFDGTSGKTLQGSGVVVDDSNAVSGVSTLSCGAITSSGNLAAVAGLFSGAVSVTDTTDSTTSTTGSLKTAGGLGVAKAVNVGTTLAVTGASTFSGNVTISKATAQMSVTATSGGAALIMSRVAGSPAYAYLATSSVSRWSFGANTAAESGGDTGSNFVINRHDDSGANIGTPLAFARSTGKVTFGDVGASAGLELGSSGPRIMSGTGSPEGVVTAPVGSQWADTAATTGAVQWIKASGSGNTGWKVAYGDTGLRDLSGVTLLNSWAVYTYFNLRRVGNLVEVNLWADKTSASADSIYTIPSGFRPAAAYARFTQATSTTDDYCRGYVTSAGDFQALRSTMTGNYAYIYFTYLTADAWPSSLPGT